MTRDRAFGRSFRAHSHRVVFGQPATWLAAEIEAEMHSPHAEYVIDVCFVCANLLFVWGSLCFFSERTTALGAGLFLVGSLAFVGLTGLTVVEQRFLEARGARGAAAAMPRDARRSPYEAAENLCYFVSALVFAGASTLYLHGYVSKAARIRGEEMGAWSFVAGSVGFMLASFVNALGLASAAASAAARAPLAARATAPPAARATAALAALALGCTQFGSVCFVTGSFLYRPALTTHCDTAALDDEEPCVSAYNEGTALYLVGSLLFLLQSAVHLLSTAIKNGDCSAGAVTWLCSLGPSAHEDPEKGALLRSSA